MLHYGSVNCLKFGCSYPIFCIYRLNFIGHHVLNISTLECARPGLALHQSQVPVSPLLQFCALIKLTSLLPAFRKHDYRPTLVCQYKENLQTTFVYFLRFLVKTAMKKTEEIIWIIWIGYFYLFS